MFGKHELNCLSTVTEIECGEWPPQKARIGKLEIFDANNRLTFGKMQLKLVLSTKIQSHISHFTPPTSVLILI